VGGSDTAWASGGSAAFRRSIWSELDSMDKLFNPFYWEDIDLSYRARKMGWDIIFEPKSIVNHYHEEGKIKSEFTPDDVKRIAYRNQFIFIWKNLTDLSIMIDHVFWTPVRLCQSLFRGDFIHIQGFFLALGMLPSALKKRQALKAKWKRSDKDLAL
jgi:GT2 family glycosyltransferase